MNIIYKPTIKQTRIETYRFVIEERGFRIEYVYNSLERKGIMTHLDERVVLGEEVINKYETPRLGNTTTSESKGHSIKTQTIREVLRDLSTNSGLTEIQQWREIPEGLEQLIDGLPTHVKTLLRLEYSDPNVKAYDFGLSNH